MAATFDARRATGLRRRPPRNGASREEMLRRRVLPLAEFVAERLRLYGSTIVPIPVPLAPGESEQAYEATFAQWLAQRHISLQELMSRADPGRERTTRCSYTVNLARAFLAAPTAVAAPTARPPTRRAADEELKEGEELEDDGAPHERSEPPLDLSLLPRHVLNATQVMTLTEYQADTKAGKFAVLGFMSAAKKLRRFGAPVAPIAVPLAPGENSQQYEQRFLSWLAREKHLTLGAVQCHKVPMLERYMRLEFASLNGKGIERFVAPHKRTATPTNNGGSPSKEKTKQTVTGRPSATGETERSEEVEKMGELRMGAVPQPVHAIGKTSPVCKTHQSSLGACLACQCDKCLVNSVRLLSERLVAHETTSRCCGSQRPVMDLTHERSPRSRETDKEDAIATQLQQAYDDINELVLLNEQSLKIEDMWLATHGSDKPVHERVHLQGENDEMRELIRNEIPGRTAKVAMLIVYLWRHDTALLMQMIDTSTVSDLPHVQQRIHERMADLAKQCEAENEELKTPQETEDDEEKGKRAHQRDRLRRHQLALLVQFDSNVRRGIRSLLAAASCAAPPGPHSAAPVA